MKYYQKQKLKQKIFAVIALVIALIMVLSLLTPVFARGSKYTDRHGCYQYRCGRAYGRTRTGKDHRRRTFFAGFASGF